MLAYCSFNMCSGVISDLLSVWFKMCLSFLSGWFRVDSGLGQWFMAGWLKVGAKCYLKSVQGLIWNFSKFIRCLLGLDLGLFWVGLTLYLAFVSGFI